MRREHSIQPMARIALAAWLAVSIPTALRAQDPQQPKESGQPRSQSRASEEMQKGMEAMGPMMGSMMQGMLDGLLTVLAKPETAQRTAAFTKNYYDALVAKGFSNDDALKIVMAHGIPIPGGR